MKKIEPIKYRVQKEDKGYSAVSTIGETFIGTDGSTYDELVSNVLEATNLALEGEGVDYTADNISFEYDLDSFFHFYKVLNVKALSERIGMNQSLLAQYIKGNKKPSPTQTRRILKGVQQIGKELAEVSFLL
jgi:hypothetical protein